jgi:alpha-L-rhamnosidase
VLASTAGAGKPFDARFLPHHIERVQRYTFQRTFSEVYHLDAHSNAWREHADVPFEPVACAIQPRRKLIHRGVPYPNYDKRQPELIAAEGEFDWSGKAPNSLMEDRSIPSAGRIGPDMLGYKWDNLEEIPYLEAQKTKTTVNNRIDQPYDPNQVLRISANQFKTFDFGTDLPGFFGAHVKVNTPSKIYFTWDETLVDGDVDFKRLMCCNVLAYTLAPGDYHLETFEPYGLEFLKVMVLSGECEIDNVFLREYAAPDVWTADFHCPDYRLNELFAAGREVFRANVIDTYQDNPTRERAPWLCDPLFSSSAAPFLCGHTKVERNMFQNYMLPDHFVGMPEGMLPNCYPADHLGGDFTPQWPLWLVVQLEDYLNRSGDREIVEGLRDRVLKLFDYFRAFQTDEGLLHDLKGWAFVEWSRSNEFVQPLNYPTNMLFAAAMAATGRMYNLPHLVEQAESLRKLIRQQSYDGKFFVDNAVLKDGKYVPTHNHSETCQYYAYFFGIATPETYPDLFKTLVNEFGVQRRATNAYPDIPPSNAFMGLVMRQDILSRAGLTNQVIKEAIEGLLYMADVSGTLWENSSNEASMNHAFEAHIVTTLYRDVAGLYKVDMVNKRVQLRFTEINLDWCEGRVPTPEGLITLRWQKKQEGLTYQLDVPAGYKVDVETVGDVKVVQRFFPHGKVNFGYKVVGGYQ